MHADKEEKVVQLPLLKRRKKKTKGRERKERCSEQSAEKKIWFFATAKTLLPPLQLTKHYIHSKAIPSLASTHAGTRFSK
ncbi:unnamed protein product [Linum trigynum]|uniref:Uncharacterized protein n=1 Tax=Linum trigynum TaxID=586398 RepID=A0AAV2EKW0_9ROSI